MVGGRSGDKASDANVGFYVRHDDEWEWLRSLLTTKKVQGLLEEEYRGGKIERFEIPGIRAGKDAGQHLPFLGRWKLTFTIVHFLLRDHLDRGFNSTSTYDTLGKNVCEYLVREIPEKL